jgi:hypothetical protein
MTERDDRGSEEKSGGDALKVLLEEDVWTDDHSWVGWAIAGLAMVVVLVAGWWLLGRPHPEPEAAVTTTGPATTTTAAATTTLPDLPLAQLLTDPQILNLPTRIPAGMVPCTDPFGTEASTTVHYLCVPSEPD